MSAPTRHVMSHARVAFGHAVVWSTTMGMYSIIVPRTCSPKVVAQRLGHAHVSVTLALFSHVLPSHDRDAAEQLARALESS